MNDKDVTSSMTRERVKGFAVEAQLWLQKSRGTVLIIYKYNFFSQLIARKRVHSGHRVHEKLCGNMFLKQMNEI